MEYRLYSSPAAPSPSTTPDPQSPGTLLQRSIIDLRQSPSRTEPSNSLSDNDGHNDNNDRASEHDHEAHDDENDITYPRTEELDPHKPDQENNTSTGTSLSGPSIPPPTCNHDHTDTQHPTPSQVPLNRECDSPATLRPDGMLSAGETESNKPLRPLPVDVVPDLSEKESPESPPIHDEPDLAQLTFEPLPEPLAEVPVLVISPEFHRRVSLPELNIEGLSSAENISDHLSEYEVRACRPRSVSEPSIPGSLQQSDYRLQPPSPVLSVTSTLLNSSTDSPRCSSPSIDAPEVSDPTYHSNGVEIAQSTNLKPPPTSTKPPRRVKVKKTVWPDDAKKFVRKPSPAAKEWQRQKDEEGAENSAIDKLMGMVGLEEVKQQMLDIRDNIETCKLQGVDLKNQRFNVVFQGNPGTGKTTVARIYAEFLHSVGLLKTDRVAEASGAKLAAMGSMFASGAIEKLVESGGGVLFVDEAYQLVSAHNRSSGGAVLDIILTEMENNIGKLAVIFAGYSKEMETFFEHNPGLSSRIPYSLNFADFDDVELWTILCDLIREIYGGDMDMENGTGGLFMRVTSRRIGRGRGRRGFGNARAVHNALQKIRERQARRVKKQLRAHRKSQISDPPNIFLFTKEDLIGPAPTVAFQSKAWARLNELVGLKEVKEAARCMIEMMETNYQRELKEKQPFEFSLNRVFWGSPGTGKTTVAKLYGEILADIGLLSSGEVVLKNPSDFIGDALGKSEANTRGILAASVGKVLIVDEAYMLGPGSGGGEGNNSQSYKAAVIDTLVAEVQSVPGDDRCILFLGYEDKIREMFRSVNPGLARRFAIEDAFRFEDFTTPELFEILELKLKDRDLTAPDAVPTIKNILERGKMRGNFSNGGEIDILLQRAVENYNKRQRKPENAGKREVDGTLRIEDFDPDHDRIASAAPNCRKSLQGHVSEEVIQQMEGYITSAQLAEKFGKDPRALVPTNFVFEGGPGTGKTTLARQMGRIFYDIGFLPTTEVVECTASDLIGQYVGQTAPKVKSLLEKALGKVLFVDEAYRLMTGQYAVEAVNELMSLLPTPRYARRMIIILAGYKVEMDNILLLYPSLAQMFPETVSFPNISIDECMALLKRELESKDISAPFLGDPSSRQYTKLYRLLKVPQEFPLWSNGREIQELAKQILNIAIRNAGSTSAVCKNVRPEISFDETLECVSNRIKLHHARCGGQHALSPLPLWATKPGATTVKPGSAPLVLRMAPPEGAPGATQTATETVVETATEMASATATSSVPVANVNCHASAQQAPNLASSNKYLAPPMPFQMMGSASIHGNSPGLPLSSNCSTLSTYTVEKDEDEVAADGQSEWYPDLSADKEEEYSRIMERQSISTRAPEEDIEAKVENNSEEKSEVPSPAVELQDVKTSQNAEQTQPASVMAETEADKSNSEVDEPKGADEQAVESVSQILEEAHRAESQSRQQESDEEDVEEEEGTATEPVVKARRFQKLHQIGKRIKEKWSKNKAVVKLDEKTTALRIMLGDDKLRVKKEEEERQIRAKRLGRCSQGFEWVKLPNGDYECTGHAHDMTAEEAAIKLKAK